MIQKSFSCLMYNEIEIRIIIFSIVIATKYVRSIAMRWFTRDYLDPERLHTSAKLLCFIRGGPTIVSNLMNWWIFTVILAPAFERKIKRMEKRIKPLLGWVRNVYNSQAICVTVNSFIAFYASFQQWWSDWITSIDSSYFFFLLSFPSSSFSQNWCSSQFSHFRFVLMQSDFFQWHFA